MSTRGEPIAQASAHWLGATGHDSGHVAARTQVAAVVQALVRARWRQIFIDCASTSLFAAVLVSIAAVLAIRFSALPLSPWVVVAGLLGVALGVAVALAFVRRPDDLQVAIQADLKLNLKQRLSTAWEFMREAAAARARDPQIAHDMADDTIGLLAAQAVKARLPAQSRAGQVFAWRANACATMTPVALIALVLVAVVDLEPVLRNTGTASDEMVISEGVRLRDYGRRMQARAQQRELPRSEAQSRRLQELGSRMQSGVLSRREALSRLSDLDESLDQARRDALNEGQQTDVGPLSTQSLRASGNGPSNGMSLQQMLQQLLDGRISPGEASSQMLGSDPSALQRSGVSAEQLAEALQRFGQGDRDTLQGMLDKMSRSGQALRERSELDNAREQIARARESLGDKGARGADESKQALAPAQAGEGGTPSENERGAQSMFNDDAGDNGSAMPGGRGEDKPSANRQPSSDGPLRADADGPTLKADARIGEGGVFVSEARVLPRAGQASIDNAAIDARYISQLEAVLANEQYPLHYKEFIRRYFLNLTQGAPAVSPEQMPQQLPQQ